MNEMGYLLGLDDLDRDGRRGLYITRLLQQSTSLHAIYHGTYVQAPRHTIASVYPAS